MRPVALIALIALAAACTDTPGRAAGTRATSDPATALSPNATVVYVTDGDTIGVEVDGVVERVRLLGIDTPEYDECGFDEASAEAEAIARDQEARHPRAVLRPRGNRVHQIAAS